MTQEFYKHVRNSPELEAFRAREEELAEMAAEYAASPYADATMSPIAQASRLAVSMTSVESSPAASAT